MINSRLKTDFYKLTMANFVNEIGLGNLNVTYSLTNRSKFKLCSVIDFDELSNAINDYVNTKFTEDELNWLEKLKTSSFYNKNESEIFTKNTIRKFKMYDSKLIDICLDVDEQTNEFDLKFSGPWIYSILLESGILAIISELYMNGIKKFLDKNILKKLNEIRLVNREYKYTRLINNRSIRLSDFGLRRHESDEQHEADVLSLRTIDYQFSGTSNTYLAMKHNIKPIGTFAHELPMVLAGYYFCKNYKNPLYSAYEIIINEWPKIFNNQLSICLTDTFTTKWFNDNFGEKCIKVFEGVRHDSNDPYKFGDEIINICENANVDPMQRVIVFSDSLNIDKIINIFNYFKSRIWVTFGWGRNLVNDCGIIPPDIVIKAYSINQQIDFKNYNEYLVKFSDTPGKVHGSIDAIEKYRKIIGE